MPNLTGNSQPVFTKNSANCLFIVFAVKQGLSYLGNLFGFDELDVPPCRRRRTAAEGTLVSVNMSVFRIP